MTVSPLSESLRSVSFSNSGGSSKINTDGFFKSAPMSETVKVSAGNKFFTSTEGFRSGSHRFISCGIRDSSFLSIPIKRFSRIETEGASSGR